MILATVLTFVAVIASAGFVVAVALGAFSPWGEP